MIKSILVPTVGGLFDARAAELALAAARLFDGHLKFLYVRPDPTELLTATLLANYGGSAIVFKQLTESLEAQSQERAEKARAAFQAWCGHEGVAVADAPDKAAGRLSAEWSEIVGPELECLINAARRCDLTVLNGPHAGDGSAREIIEALLLSSGRPVLLRPWEPWKRLASKVAIAWKNTPEAARAVLAAMPFIEKADEVAVLTIEETASIDPNTPQRLAHELRWHCPAVHAEALPAGDRSGAEALKIAARERKADLLVMGGYGHSRLGELIFGGFTRHILDDVQLPVLMMH